MATIVTDTIIKQINQLYYEYHNYSKVARELNLSPSTVKKYVDPNYAPINEALIIKFNPEVDMPKEFKTDLFMNTNNFGDLCALTSEEKEGIKVLHGEMEI